MNEFLEFALAHHLYIFPLAAIALWLLPKWGASPKPPRRREPAKQEKKPDRAGARDGSGHGAVGRPGGEVTIPALEAQHAELAQRRAGLEQELRALEAHDRARRTASAGGASGKKKRKR